MTPPTPPVPLALLLKQSTQTQHDEAEAHPFQKRFSAGGLTAAEYATFLVQVRYVHEVYEAALRAVHHPALRALVTPHHFRLERIDQDLRDLAEMGVRPLEAHPFRATHRFAADVERTAREHPAGLIGVLYVLEGATNGNKIIVRAVRNALGLAEGRASGYLDPHGSEQRLRWMALKGGLDAAPVSDAERHYAVEAARRTFTYFAELGEELERSGALVH